LVRHAPRAQRLVAARNGRRNEPGTLALYNSLAVSVSSSSVTHQTRLRAGALALTLGTLSVAACVLAFVVQSLNLAAGVQDFPYASGNALTAIFSGPIGALIAARRPGLSVGWVMLAVALLSGIDGLAGECGPYAYSSGIEALRVVGAWSSWLASWLWIVSGSLLLGLLPAVFPTGRLPSNRWWILVWAGAAATALLVLAEVLPAGSLYWTDTIPNPAGVGWSAPLTQVRPAFFLLHLVATTGAAALATVLRFWRARGVERQQIKWFAFAIAMWAFIWAGASLVDIARSERVLRTSPAIAMLGLTLMFGSIAIGILRYRLLDIDIIINRTLVYGIVTALLAGAFAALSVLTQRLTLVVTGQESEVAVVLAALVVTALFQPLRLRVQTLVDRRFYRSKYDATRTLERFANRVRDEVELDHLTNSLVGVVTDTMQPKHVSLWLRPPTARAEDRH
jgi:hypothetical protein